jgi:AcrR family transcriptional regulator
MVPPKLRRVGLSGGIEAAPATHGLGVVQYSRAQTRVLDAALDLFAVHGVSGTSLRMIAAFIGVTKDAVYHQFRTTEEIVITVTERELARLIPALERAEAHGDLPQARV